MVKIISINFVGFRINISPESLALYIKEGMRDSALFKKNCFYSYRFSHY